MVGFYYPDNLPEALDIRRDSGAIPLAGGTDLMVRYENWSSLPPRFPGNIMGIAHLKELKYLRKEESFVAIGAGMTLGEILQSPLVPDLLKSSLTEIAAPAIRNLATLAGNIANSSPAADSLPPLVVADSSVRLISAMGTRIVKLSEFITGPGKNVLSGDELIEAVLIPLDFTDREREGRGFYRKVGTRKANALSKLSYSGWGKVSGDRLDEIRLCVGGVAPVVVRLPQAESSMAGNPLKDLPELWQSVRGAYESRITPIDDQRSTAAYRKRTALKLLDYMIDQLSSS